MPDIDHLWATQLPKNFACVVVEDVSADEQQGTRVLAVVCSSYIKGRASTSFRQLPLLIESAAVLPLLYWRIRCR
jgi:hypothetical protein